MSLEYIKVDVSGNPSNDELKRRANRAMNGEYVIWVCRNCGCYAASLESTEEIKIIDHCFACFAVPVDGERTPPEKEKQDDNNQR